MDDEAVLDDRGRVLIPINIREKLNIGEGSVLQVEEKHRTIVLKPSRKLRKTLKDFYGLDPKRTGKPTWATPKEIKSIWE